MPSQSENSTFSNRVRALANLEPPENFNRRGRLPAASVRALTNLELRRQLVRIRHETLEELGSEQSSVCRTKFPRGSSSALLTRSSNAESRTNTSLAPGQAQDRRNSWSGTASLIPAPLNPRRRPSSRSSLSPTRLPTPPPPYSKYPLPLTSGPTAGRTTDIPATIAQTRSIQHETELELAMLELRIELQQFRHLCD